MRLFGLIEKGGFESLAIRHHPEDRPIRKQFTAPVLSNSQMTYLYLQRLLNSLVQFDERGDAVVGGSDDAKREAARTRPQRSEWKVAAADGLQPASDVFAAPKPDLAHPGQPEFVLSTSCFMDGSHVY